ncbi:hypothetical protein [Ruminococcus sp. YE282]|jgi:hypothetical protein|uniref:hypothetical protein n=1 Tax=Ruminococcus sp. YE282 TaxID=3158780 RepID=UPI0008819E74|nr:hypothetical protein [Ruminococcus bromii]MEE3499043.1 hypothetical protein [Ruminococcus bromii]SCY51164.1 hypothetical protein SAMN02910441_01623 [Ruminococcus bromii]HCB95039.1 hypothetical protein [Ruminococcus sp.]
MSEIEDKINQILSNPEALKQVQSLGKQLGLSGFEPPPPPKPSTVPSGLSNSNAISDDMLSTITRIAPIMQQMKNEDDTTRLLYALKPFLSGDKQKKLENAEKMIKFIRIIPYLKDNGLFF